MERQIGEGEYCACQGALSDVDRRCPHRGRCERRHGRKGEVLTLRYSAPYCGACRMWHGDDPDQIRASSVKERRRLEIGAGQQMLVLED